MATNYIDFIDESVSYARDQLERSELLHYIDEETADVDGSKAERDEIGCRKAYELSVYSNLLVIQKSLHELRDKGSTPALALVDEETKTEDVNIEEILKGDKNVKVIKVELKDDLIGMFEEIVEKLKKDKENK